MNNFSIDYRSLRFFRCGLGLFLILDLLFRLPNFVEFYTNAGVYPRDLATDGVGQYGQYFSLFFVSDSTWWAASLFAAAALTGALLIADIAPRWTSLVAFILVLSLRHRIPMVGYGGDDLFRLGLLWSVWLPPGPTSAGNSFRNPASVAVLVQLCVFYFTTGMCKLPEEWLTSAAATYIALSSDTYARPAGIILLQFPGLLKLSSIGVFFTERLGWLLFISPWRTATLRTLAFFIFAAMHISFGMFLHLQLFPLIDMVWLVLLLPSEFWDRWKIQHAGRIRTPFRFERYVSRFSLVFVATISFINISLLPQVQIEVPTPVIRAAKTLGLFQTWSMFSPVTGMSDGYNSVIGTTEDGRMIDLFHQKIISQWPPKPRDGQSVQGGFRWTRFLETVRHKEDERINETFVQYFCRRWNPTDPSLKKKLAVEWRFNFEQTSGFGLPVFSDFKTIHKSTCD